MKLDLLATANLRIDRSALAAEFQQATGRALRRTGVLPALALLACLRAIQAETWTGPRQALPTLLLWHTRSVITEEATPLLRMMIEDREALMPYDFLASQPALMGVNLQTHFPELSLAVCLPWVDEAGTDRWLRALQLAALGLREQNCQRVICLQLDRDAQHLQAQALSLTLDATGPQAITTLDASQPLELQLDDGVLSVRAR